MHATISRILMHNFLLVPNVFTRKFASFAFLCFNLRSVSSKPGRKLLIDAMHCRLDIHTHTKNETHLQLEHLLQNNTQPFFYLV